MKKTLLTIAAVVSCAAIMASCGGNTANTVSDNKNTTSTSVTTVATTEPTTVQLTTATTSNLEKKNETASTAKTTAAKTTAKKAAATTKKAAPKTTAKKVSSNSSSKKNYEKWTTYDFGEKGTYEIYQKSDGTWVCQYSDAHNSNATYGKTKNEVDPRIKKTTAKKQVGLTKADYEWATQKGIEYIKSLPNAFIQSDASGYRFGVIYPPTYINSKEALLNNLKECIDIEYEPVINGKWNKAGMSLTYSKDSEGDFYFTLRCDAWS